MPKMARLVWTPELARLISNCHKSRPFLWFLLLENRPVYDI